MANLMGEELFPPFHYVCQVKKILEKIAILFHRSHKELDYIDTLLKQKLVMDDLKKKIAFRNVGLQIQTLWRLGKDIGKKVSPGTKVDASTPEIIELSLLLDCLCGDEDVAAQVASQVLLHLVEEDVLDFTLALNSVLNSVPSAKTLSGVVKTVYGLLTLQALVIEAKDGKYTCPYVLRTPPHPLISVITNRPEGWSFVVQEALTLLRHEDKRIMRISVELLKPVFMFVLLEPQQSDQYTDVRTGFQRLLSEAYRSGEDEQALELVHLLLTLLPKMQVEKKKNLIFVSQLIEEMASLINKKVIPGEQDNQLPHSGDQNQSVATWQSLAGGLFTAGLETVLMGCRIGVPFSGVLAELVTLAQCGSQASINSNMVLLSDILGDAHVFTSPHLISLAQMVVTCSSSSPNVLCLATIVKPLLQILALPKTDLSSSIQRHQQALRDAAGHLLVDIQSMLASASSQVGSNQEEITSLPVHISSAGYKSMLVTDLCQMLTKTSQTSSAARPDNILKSWLDNVSSTLHQQESSTDGLTNLVSAILITSKSVLVTKAAVNVITKIAELDQKQAPDFIPLILFSLSYIKHPESRLILLEAIPNLATHKYCVSPILKTIQILGKSPDLKAVSIRLLVILWQRQVRCFPQLLQAVSEPHKPSLLLKDSSDTDNVLLAKAAAILEICKHKPELHGADLLAPLSEILQLAGSDRDTAASVLALEGLCLLCQAEVIDLRSVWAVLGEKLKHEARPLVITRICQLLSLVPDLCVETEEYEAFAEDAVSSLWLYSASTNVMVSAAAFSALAKFNPGNFHVSHLPRKVTEELYSQAEMAASQQQVESGESGDAVNVDQMFAQVPGYCYTLLLEQLTDVEIIAGFQKCMQAMIAKEVANLPRGVYYSSLRRQAVASNQGKAVETIPRFLLQQYERCKQPGLRPGLAAGQLFTYDPPVEVGRDGRPRKHYIVRHGKSFLQTFTTLLNEVPVQPSEWHRSSLMPQCWNSFMERLFLSMLESRRTELELQEAHEKAVPAVNTEEKKSQAWLVVRDSIVEVIKTASLGTPTAQANCALALAGLALCVHRFAADLGSEKIEATNRSSEHMGHVHWLTVTSDTIFSLIDVEYKPKGGLHGLCQQRSTLDRSPASTLCSGTARLAASQLVPVFIAVDTDRIQHLLSAFVAALPKGGKALESPLLAFCNGLALGMLLGRLFEDHYSEMTGSKGMLAVWKSLTALEDVSLTAGVENRSGCVLGLGLALCGMLTEGKTESRVHVSSVLEKLQNLWMGTPVNDHVYQPLCVTVTSIAGSLYASNASSVETILPVINRLQQLHQENPQISGICLALGLLTFSLHKQGLKSVSQLRQELVKQWLQDVISQDVSQVERVAKLTGLLSMVGSEQTLIPIQGSSVMAGSDLNVSEVVTTVMKIVVDNNDLGLQSIGAWLLGHLYLSACAVAENRSAVPANYSHLPESSILRATVDFLLEAGRLGPDSVHPRIVIAALESLKLKAVLPPLNWAALLSPFMRVNFGEKVKALSLQVAASQMVSSSSASMFMSSWLTPPLFTSLERETQVVLHQCMPDIIRTTTPSVLKSYLEHSCLPAFTQGSDTSVQLSVLQGLCAALAVDDPPAGVTLLLLEMTRQLYHVLPDDFNISLLHSMAECLAQVPDDVMDSIIVADFTDASTQIKGSFVRCHLVATGRQPLSLLNYMIDASFNTDYWRHDVGMLLLANCLASFSKTKGELSELQVRQQWLLELLGHTHTLVTGAMPLAPTAAAKPKVISYAINVVTCTILTLTFPVNAEFNFWGLHSRVFVSRPESPVETPSLVVPSLQILYADMARYLPVAVDILFRKPWDVVLPKIFNWLMTLLEQSEISPSDTHILYAALMALRHGQEMRQASMWTKAAILV